MVITFAFIDLLIKVKMLLVPIFLQGFYTRLQMFNFQLVVFLQI